MTPNSSNDASPESSEVDIDESEIARLLRRYFDSTESVSDDDLRTHLQKTVRGTIVELDPGNTDLTVVIEQPASEEGKPIRNCYAVRHVTNLDGELTLGWSYLGQVD